MGSKRTTGRSSGRRRTVAAVALAVAATGALGGTGASAAPAPGGPTSSSVVLTAGFDGGTTDGFVGDPATVAVSPAGAGRTGAGALYTFRLTGYGQGASVTLPRGLADGYYAAGAWVRLPLWTGALAEPQDLRIAFPGSPSVGVVQTGVGRATATGYRYVVTYFRVTGGATAQPPRLRVEPVAACPDAPRVPGPFLLDDVTVSFIGTLPPPLPLLPAPACPLRPATA